MSLPSVEGSRIPIYEPKLSGGEGLSSCAITNAIPSPEMVKFVRILKTKVVENEAGHAVTGYLNRTRAIWFFCCGFCCDSSGVRFNVPFVAVTDPKQINLLSLSSQIPGTNDWKEKLNDCTRKKDC